ncbi:aspartate--ammonia ligase, partial [Aliidiomarina sanyensis]
GIVTHMKALRADEETLSPVHSVYVDQWDWEQIIADRHRTEAQLHTTVRSIYTALKQTLEQYKEGFGSSLSLPETITFVRSEDLLQAYPELSPKEREHAAAEEHGAIFLQGIGGALSDGTIHDVRAPDYDDWTLNGDIIVWNPVLGESLELSSMGIRVDRAALLKQLQSSGRASAEGLPWHQKLISGQLPQTIGGGIGQSRLCMWMMQKPHIGYVQHGVWCPETRTKYADLL